MKEQRNNGEVKEIKLSKLVPFRDHPFKVIDDEEMNQLIESVQMQGILSPLTVRPIEGTADEYEVISGHRRLHAAIKAGLETVPALIFAIDHDTAAIMVVDSNLHREHILPSEKAFAYKMKYSAIKHQGTSSQLETKLRSDEILAADSGESRAQVQRYIRLTNLVPELLDWMDKGKIALSVGVELSFLSDEAQHCVFENCELYGCTPSYSQTVRMRKLYNERQLTRDDVSNMLSQEKPNQRETIKVPAERLRNIVPESYTAKKTEDFLVKAAEYYRRYLQRQRDQER